MTKLGYLKETPSQTAGPFVHIGLTPTVSGIVGVYPDDLGGVVAGPKAEGQKIRVEGMILDGMGAPIRDGLIEVWQADAKGIYNSAEDPRYADRDPAVNGWGRIVADLSTGMYAFDSIKPGRVPGPGGSMMAPHISFWMVARGINIGLSTRLYFPDEDAANSEDPILKRIEHGERRTTLIAMADGEVDGVNRYRFDVHLQGEKETVFFDC